MSSRIPVAKVVGRVPYVSSEARSDAKADCIQYIRAVAAMLVVFYHETVYLQRITGDSSLHDFFGGRPGLYGVVAFFVISGFLMADIAPKYDAVTFIGHRIIRIYPTYWICVGLAAIFFVWLWWVTLPNSDYVPNIRTMLLSHGISRDLLRLTLVPMIFPDFPLGIEWTLLYETTFYAIIFIVIALSQVHRLQYFAIGWLLLIVAMLWVDPANEARYTAPSILTLPFFAINSGFIFGILGARWRRRIRAFPAIVIGLSLLVHVEVFPSSFSMIEVAAGIAAIIMGLLSLERNGSLPRLAWLHRLGDWSYAMYLVHVPLILAVFKLMQGLPTLLMLLTAAFSVLAVSAAVGQIDLAIYYRLKRELDRGPTVARTALACAFLAVFASAAVYGINLV